MLSGVPQGSVLGPILFLIYINDLPEYVSNSTVRLFADDTLLYLTIHNSSDCIKLQEDLNNLERWESDWQMSFHPEKCEVIHITTKKKPIIHKYMLHGHTLFSVPQIKYLGVNISQDLKWNSHINSVSSKANQTLGFLKRNLKINSQSIKEKAYKSFVRPKLEYCNTVWDPKCIKNPKEGDKTNHRLVYQIEMVQRRAARWVTGRYHNTSSVSDMLRSLDWRSLEQRRVDSSLTILYKIRNLRAIYAALNSLPPFSIQTMRTLGIRCIVHGATKDLCIYAAYRVLCGSKLHSSIGFLTCTRKSEDESDQFPLLI